MNDYDPEVRLIRVIETRLTRRGTGTHASPNRVVTQWWTLDGRLLAEDDPEAHCAQGRFASGVAIDTSKRDPLA